MWQVAFAFGYGVVLYLLAWYCTQPVLAGIGFVLAAWMFIAGTIQAWRESREHD